MVYVGVLPPLLQDIRDCGAKVILRQNDKSLVCIALTYTNKHRDRHRQRKVSGVIRIGGNNEGAHLVGGTGRQWMLLRDEANTVVSSDLVDQLNSFWDIFEVDKHE